GVRACGRSGRLHDLARLQAARADAQVRAATVDQRVDALQVRQRALLGLVVGVAHLVTGEWPLAAHVALERHLLLDPEAKERRNLPGNSSVSSRGDLLAPADLQRLRRAGARGQQRTLQAEPRVHLARREQDALVSPRERP